MFLHKKIEKNQKLKKKLAIIKIYFEIAFFFFFCVPQKVAFLSAVPERGGGQAGLYSFSLPRFVHSWDIDVPADLWITWRSGFSAAAGSIVGAYRCPHSPLNLVIDKQICRHRTLVLVQTKQVTVFFSVYVCGGQWEKDCF